MNKENQSISDMLLRIMPSLMPSIKIDSRSRVNPVAANSLYNIWKDEHNKINKNIYRRPVTISKYEINIMKENNLIRENGFNIEITDAGSEVIKIMALGDDSSSFDKKSSVIDFDKALMASNSKSVKLSSLNKTASSSWWNRFE